MNVRNLLLITVLFFSLPRLAHAGFAVNSSHAASANTKSIAARNQALAATFFQKKADQLKSIFHTHPENLPNHKGTLGTLAFVFGFCGLIPVIGALFSIAAIILGAMGMHKHQKHALAGLILGIGTITLGIILTIMIFASI